MLQFVTEHVYSAGFVAIASICFQLHTWKGKLQRRSEILHISMFKTVCCLAFRLETQCLKGLLKRLLRVMKVGILVFLLEGLWIFLETCEKRWMRRCNRVQQKSVVSISCTTVDYVSWQEIGGKHDWDITSLSLVLFVSRPNRHNMTKTQRMIFIDRSFKKDKSGAFDTALLWHTDLDNGDLDVGSAAWHLLQRYANLLAALDKLPQPMVFSGSIVKGLVQHDPYIWPPVLIMRAAECPRPCENQLFHDVIKPKAISVLNDDGSLKKSSRISSMKWRKLTTRLRLRAEACPYNVFHFTWHMPEPSVEEGVPQGNKGFVKRVYSKGNVTGCCDRTVALAITSVLVHYPDAEVVLWTQGDPLLDESLVQTRLVNSTRVHVVSLNGKVEKAFASGTPAFDWVQGHSKSTHESIKWSDLFRLLILWHVGGSYFDADAITTSSVKSFARQRDLPLCNATRMLSVKPAVGGSIPSAAVPDWDGRVEKRKESGGRKEFNYYAQNGLLFGFPPNDPIFVRAMEIFVEGYSKGRTGFFSGGPQDFSRAVAATLREEEAKHLSPNQSIHFSQGVCDCSNHAASNTKLNVEVKDANPNTLILHTDLDYGDLETGSRTYLMLQKYAYALETLEKRKQPLLDGIPHTPLKHVDVLREKECIAWNCHLAK
eukprot:m.141302 g.141302  ORF g.141302 m.141302 type:complete len:656 (+) comp14844_c0_seq1:843-2810(+)